ncbi:MAG: peptidoglycan-binding protein [Clostridia bacterium]|nr:peptidoglycan-binding protein [Clostridia bacterium]
MKRLILSLILLATLFTLSGCFVSPDPTLEPLEITGNEVPFGTVQALPTIAATPTPEPTPSPTPDTWQNSDQSTWEDWASDVMPTTTPRTASTMSPGASNWQTSTTDYNAGYPVLRLGSTGTDVSDLQARLTELRYYSGVIDGKYNADTQKAVMEFQEKNGLTADGIAGRQTQDLLYSTGAQAKVISVSTEEDSGGYILLKEGASGMEVRKIQARLAELGYYSGGTDGLYGSTTTEAVKAFQRANGLSADGQAGAKTQTKLFSATAVYAATPVTTADPSATRTLTLGMTGNDVYAVQERLIALRYLNGIPDGVFGEETQNALMAFQKNNGLTVDGSAGASTLKRLFGSARAAGGSTPTPVPAGATVLHEGDSGEAVYQMQTRLFELGFYSGRIDGRFGPDTTEAVKAFQAANGLTVDGVPGKGTFARLNSAAAVPAGTVTQTEPVTETVTATAEPETVTSSLVLRKGDRGEAVTLLQQTLKKLGYLETEPDGQFGSGTENAIRAFQRANGLTADGVAGRGTLAILYSNEAVAAARTVASTPSVTATPKPNTNIVLQWQSEGADVLQYQTRLAELGYLSSKNVTGKFNQPTVDATKAFQTMNGLKVDGAAGSQSLKLIYSNDALDANGVRAGDRSGAVDTQPEQLLKTGMTGEQVRLLQSQLAALGYLSASFSSGVYDRETEQAVRRFQAANGLPVDGQAGSATQSLAVSSRARSAAAQSLSVSNRARENEEQRLNGANQSSLNGGGFLCSGGGKLYYADPERGGILVSSDGSHVRQLSEDHPRSLHCTNGRLYFIAEDQGSDCIVRMNVDGSSREILLRSEVLVEFLLHDGVLYYLDAAGNIKERTLSGEERVLIGGAHGFTLDVETGHLLCLMAETVVNLDLRSGTQSVIFTGTAEEALCMGDRVLVLSAGRVVRLSPGENAAISSHSAVHIGAYLDRIIEVTGSGIDVYDINGENRRTVLAGTFECFAVAGGMLYAGNRDGFTQKVQL